MQVIYDNMIIGDGVQSLEHSFEESYNNLDLIESNMFLNEVWAKLSKYYGKRDVLILRMRIEDPVNNTFDVIASELGLTKNYTMLKYRTLLGRLQSNDKIKNYLIGRH